MEQPGKGFFIGSMAFLGVLVLAIIILSIVFRKGHCCYANNFGIILIVMAYIMWACTYLCQMYPLVEPEYSNTD